MTRPLVSILIPLYNKAEWIEATLCSALAQTYDQIEVLLIDDGSTDNSVEVALGIDDPRVRIVARENRGANVTRNELLALAQGTFIQFLDADDLLAPQKIETQIGDLIGGATVSICGVDRDGLTMPQVHDGVTVDGRLLVHHGLHTASPLHRKEALVAVGGWADDLPAGQEWDLHCRLFLAGLWDHAAVRPEVLATWTVVPGSVSSDETTVYRAKVASIRTLGVNAPDPVRQALGEAAANAGRHLARAGYFKEASEALALASQLTVNTQAAWPRRLRWVSSTPIAPFAEWLDDHVRSAISRLDRTK